MDSRQADRAVIAHLLDKYGMESLMGLIQSVSSSTPSSRMSTNTWLSDAGFIPTSISASNSPLAFSDAGSVSGSMYESAGPEASAAAYISGALGTGSVASTSSRRGGRTSSSIASNISPSPSVRKQRPPVECPFCSELNISVSIARKADLKRHLTKFHRENAQWICSVPGCQLAFDFRAGFEGHLKEVHKGIHLSADDAMVRTCPQVVFACGFVNCKQIYEAAGDSESDAKAQEYFNHVAKHMADEGMTHSHWSYSVRFRNLMRQRAVEDAWKRRDKDSHQRLGWRPATSAALRKVLETRHIGDAHLLVQWAASLGSLDTSKQAFDVPTLPEGLALPLRDTCTLTLPGHKPSSRGGYAPPRSQGGRGQSSMSAQQQVPFSGLPGVGQSRFRSPPGVGASNVRRFSQYVGSASGSSQSQTPSSVATSMSYQSPPLGSDTSQAPAGPVYWADIGDFGSYAGHGDVMSDWSRHAPVSGAGQAGPSQAHYVYSQQMGADNDDDDDEDEEEVADDVTMGLGHGY